MAQFTVPWSFTGRMHAAMEKRGFSREITSDSGQTYRLPTAEYSRTSDKTRDEIRDSASAGRKDERRGVRDSCH
jgi:hypothetical protein